MFYFFLAYVLTPIFSLLMLWSAFGLFLRGFRCKVGSNHGLPGRLFEPDDDFPNRSLAIFFYTLAALFFLTLMVGSWELARKIAPPIPKFNITVGTGGQHFA